MSTPARPWERRVTSDPDRCHHDLLACRRCATAQPGTNRHWPQGPTPPREGPGYGPRLRFLPRYNRADRRAAGNRRTAGRRAAARQAAANRGW